MLSRDRKVSRGLFQSVIKKGTPYHTDHLSLKTLKVKNSSKNSIFSFVVSKKVARLATQRNLLKRRGYYVVGKVLSGTQKGCAGVFFFKKGAVETIFSDLEKEILSLLKQAKILV